MLKAEVKTDRGKKRANNEDAFYVNAAEGLFIVADGMGGHQAGEVASSMAIKEIRGYVEALGSEVTTEGLEGAVQVAHKAIYLKSMEDPALHGMGTTVVVAVIREGRLLLAHVGDSRAYLLSEGGLKRFTEDHSVVAQLVKEGRLTEEEARRHPRRGVILQALGVERTVEVDTQELPYNGELLLLCTDGLTDMLRDEEIEEILHHNPDPQQACDLLVERANEAGGVDNVTVILVVKG